MGADVVTERYLCIHGHFYQPPRENPWLEYLERQPSASPYHDWNERITAECYAPNAAARILDEQGRIRAIHNNYLSMSFNFGPTLLSWMEKRAPETYATILEADRRSAQRFSGHGSAIAQAYNHLIMPLASRRDKITQVRWGIADFRSRFGREPEGMWLPEAAVDLESLALLAEHGIKFTILSPGQARRVRRVGDEEWTDVSGDRVDPRIPYLVRLPQGRSISVFFYDGPVARAAAFENLLRDGVGFAERLVSTFSDDGPPVQLAHIANDGETFGHHHRYGEMALAYALHHIEQKKLARVTNYGEFLSLCPPQHEAEIVENSSWSCIHGVERWRSDCGCSTGEFPPGKQGWRRALRTSLDWLRDQVAELFDRHGRELFPDPWAARDAYIQVILDRSPAQVEAFFAQRARPGLGAAERRKALELLEMQRHAMLMFTSCGWFFDDLARIETIQILAYAARSVQLCEDATGAKLEHELVEKLAFVRSNDPRRGNGRQVWETLVRPHRVDLEKVGAHYAIRSLFEAGAGQERAYCYRVERHDFKNLAAGMARGSVGRLTVTSELTGESAELCCAVLHFGDHTVNGGVHRRESVEAFQTLAAALADAFLHADLTRALRLVDEHFGDAVYTISALFRDEQHRIIDHILGSSVEAAIEAYEKIYAQNAPLLRYLRVLGLEAPRAMEAAGELAINMRLRAAFEADEPDLEVVHRLLDEAHETAVRLDVERLAFALSGTLERGLRQLAARPGDLAAAQRLVDVAAMVLGLPFKVELWGAQNIFYRDVLDGLADYRARAERGDSHAQGWVESMQRLGEALRIRLG
jgi:alpha-amylase/alpha-mannosidase (GH57 family)